MTAAEQPAGAPGDAVAAAIKEVLAAHWSYQPTQNFRAWLCECGSRIAGRDVEDIHVAMQAHVAEALAAANLLATPPTASHDETALMAAVEAWDCDCLGRDEPEHTLHCDARFGGHFRAILTARAAAGGETLTPPHG